MDNDKIEDVERGANQIFFVRTLKFRQDRQKCRSNFGFRQDRQTDRQTDRRNKHMVSLPCF